MGSLFSSLATVHDPGCPIFKASRQCSPRHLISVFGQLTLDLLTSCCLLRFRELSSIHLLALIERGALGFPPLLQPVYRVSISRKLKCPSTFREKIKEIRQQSSYLETTSWHFDPNSWLSLPTEQYLRPGLSLRTRRACGTTTRF